jgi:arsenate reductase
MELITVYGLKNCDTCRAALKWLDSQSIAHRFHDIRAEGLTARTISTWVAALGWETVLNRRSTTWRELADKDRDNLNDKRAVALMAAHPTLVKRPVIEAGKALSVGFTDAVKKGLAKSGT